MNIFKKYEMLKTKEQEPLELKKIKKDIKYQDKEKLIDKILKSNEIDKLISKVQGFYYKIYDKLFTKYDLKNELKQGKLFTIVILVLIFLYLVIAALFSVITFNSLLGLNLLFSLVKYTLFFCKWSYTIIKNKGNVMWKYLGNLFPNSKILNQEIKPVASYLPLFETNIITEIKDVIHYLETNHFDNNFLSKIAISLQEVNDMLDIHSDTFSEEFKSLSYKQEISQKIIMIKEEIKEYERQKDLRINLDYEKQELANEIKSLEKVKKIGRR